MSVMGKTVYNGFMVASVLSALVTAILVMFGPDGWSLAGRAIRVEWDGEGDVEWHYVELSPGKKIFGLLCVILSFCAWFNGQAYEGWISIGWMILIIPHMMMIQQRLSRRRVALQSSSKASHTVPPSSPPPPYQ
jgi:hypothetical protein